MPSLFPSLHTLKLATPVPALPDSHHRGGDGGACASGRRPSLLFNSASGFRIQQQTVQSDAALDASWNWRLIIAISAPQSTTYQRRNCLRTTCNLPAECGPVLVQFPSLQIRRRVDVHLVKHVYQCRPSLAYLALTRSCQCQCNICLHMQTRPQPTVWPATVSPSSGTPNALWRSQTLPVDPSPYKDLFVSFLFWS